MSPNNSQAQVLRSLLSTKVDKLYRLQDIGTTRSWDYSLPTISSHRGFTDRLNLKSDESFFDIFKKSVNDELPYKILEDAGVFEEGNDLVLFGGCILDIILKRHECINDFDIRLVGESYMNDEQKCIDRAKQFVASIFSSLLKENEKIDEQCAIAKKEGRSFYANKCDLQEIVVSRSRSTVTIHVPSFGDKRACVFQLTFSPTNNVKDMLAECLPHCTRLAIKNGAVVLDHMARYCIESTCVVLDTTSLKNYYCKDANNDADETKQLSSGRTLASQLSRYITYYEEKGFDIIIPELDMSKVPRRNLEHDVEEVMSLPSMIVVYDAIDKNQIMTTRLDLSKNLKSKIPASGLIGNYDSSPAPNVGEEIHYNIRCLVNEVYDSFKYVSQGERWDHVFDYVPSLTPRMVRKSYETVMADLESGVINIEKLTGYFSVTSPDVVLDKIIAQPLRRDICRKGTLPKTFIVDHDDLKELTEKEVSSLIDKIVGLRETLKSKGLDVLVSLYPKNVSTADEIFDAIYGSNGLQRKDQE